ncbi:centromere protein J-like [Macrosteles quadrilineatus]|uniref:centromere protein J-like n=1 Tax=Macrosteles quadrilineatus TaxID=74068 RepID=UPI0023E2BF70|nr:centromere protein J-like [Macrosteles quadrilineatus]
MAAVLQRQPLTIKQQVEELKNWHKQQQSKIDDKTVDRNSTSREIKNNGYFTNPSCESSPNSRINFDEIPIKVSNSNFTALVENNVSPVDSHETKKLEGKDKPKFRFLKRGEGIARFNMGPSKNSKKFIPRRQPSLKLIKEPAKSSENPKLVSHHSSIQSRKSEDIPTLKAPDLKLNFTWKSILSGGNPEDMLEKVINSNHFEKMDPNSSIDSSTASLMEKLLALGKNRLSRDREELRVFETLEQHMLDSSFCSTSSYVNKLMENAVMSTPNKGKIESQQYKTQAITSKYSNQLPEKIQSVIEQNTQEKTVVPGMAAASAHEAKNDKEENMTENGVINEELQSYQNKNKNSTELEPRHAVATWTTNANRSEENCISVESSLEDCEQSLHVRFADKINYKSFVEQSQSIDSGSLKDGNRITEFDESHEWREESSSSCSQCSNQSSDEDARPFIPQDEQSFRNLQNERNPSQECLRVTDLLKNENHENNEASSNNDHNFPPLLLAKLKELEEEIIIFREENSNIKALRESLERERRQIQEEKRRMNLEKKKLQKELEEEKKQLKAHLEEEKQKLAKEKVTFEKYSKSLTKNPTREERKEIQALKEQLTEMKEELNKKESRWGAAQARVRNQVKVLEEDNKKLKEEIETFRKQAKYWDLFNQKKKGKPFNNTKLIHAISEHISNLVLDEENHREKSNKNEGCFTKKLSGTETTQSNFRSSATQLDLQSMYGVKVIRQNVNREPPNFNNTSKSNPTQEEISVNKAESVVTLNDSQGSSKKITTITSTQAEIFDNNSQVADRCSKPQLEEESNTIKEVTDESGNVEITFPNGNIKKMNKITGSEKYIYINGDVEEITRDGTVKYYYSKSRIWQTTLPDGLEIVDFPDGKIEKRHVDGTVEIVYSNNNKKISYPNGSQEIIYTDGTRLRIEADKTQILTLPNGQKEIHTAEWKRREYPDGTMKTLFPDGTTETVYSNGRVRLKDKYGNLVMDSGSPSHGFTQ